MKKTQTFKMAVAVFAVAGLALSACLPAIAATVEPDAGSLIKGESFSTIYYLGEDNKRYVFPNAKTFFSWYDDFEEVVEVSDEVLMSYPLGGNVHYRPGALLVKITTDPKVYAVGQNGNLRWVKSEALARSLYGANWNLLVDDVADSLFTNYSVGDPVESDSEFDPEEEEEEIPTPSYNLGFKERLQAQIQEQAQERRCNRLEKFINRIQKRMDRFGIEADGLGEDYLNQCFAGDTDDESAGAPSRYRWHSQGKVEICHIPAGNPAAAQTISVGAAAAKAHLAHGDTLGACGSEPADDEPGGDEGDDNGDEGDDEETDTTAPDITGLNHEETATATVLFSWTTNEDADSKVVYYKDADGAASSTEEYVDEEVTEHEIEISGFATSTLYWYYVESADPSGNATTSDEYSFEL